MAELSTIGVAGTVDGVVPVYQPDARWCWWKLSELWNGTHGTNRYVPKVDDYVIDPDTFATWRVAHIDPVTLIPRLEVKRPANMSTAFTETDVLFGVGPGPESQIYRVYLDTSVVPYTLSVDTYVKIYGTLTSYVKIFKGTDVSSTGRIVSKMFDSSGNFITNNVPLELVAIDSHNNYSVKCVQVCYTNDALVDGEIVTVVGYSDEGHVVNKRQFLIENTSFIRSVNVSTKYITHISLESPFLSPTMNQLIEFPLNTPINTLSVQGVVNYSDGSVLKLPVDGSKFKLFGVEQYVSTIIGQHIDLLLSYTLSPGEVNYSAVSGEGKYITQPYTIVTVDPNNSYKVKLFGYPLWSGETTGYRMQWFLYNLDRTVFYNVTDKVRFANSTGAFDPFGFGYAQRKAVQLNLQEVSGSFKPYIHVQLVDIVLRSPPNGSLTPWLVSHESVGERPMYGEGLIAKLQVPSRRLFKIDAGIATLEEWLEQVFDRTYPLVDTYLEERVPRPTHFTVFQGSFENVYPIAQWNQPLAFGQDIVEGSTVFIRFSKRTASNDMLLAVAGMTASSI